MLHVQLGEHVTMADLNKRAAALECEARLEALRGTGVVFVNATVLKSVELEAQGVLLFLLQRALRHPGLEVLITAPRGVQHALERTHARKLLASQRVRLFTCEAEAREYMQVREVA